MADKKEYIERGALIRLFDERYITAIVQQKHDDVPEDHKKHWKGVQSGTNWCKNTVLEAPAADVVEVVRCKDCAWSRMIVVNGKPEYYCQCWNPGNVIHVDALGFCMWGERNEQT